MPPSDFGQVDIGSVLANLTTREAILLTAGEGFWHTQAVERLGIPAVKVCYTVLSILHRTFRR